MPGTTPLRVAVVGSGPAGIYTAEALIKQSAALPDPPEIRVDVLDRLPTPYGLVRYGVAPDHTSIKSIARYLQRVLEQPAVRFLGGIHLGESGSAGQVSRDDLVDCYDAVVYATGAMRDRKLGVPGEDLPGSAAATDFVNWYCGHPDMRSEAFNVDAESVAVIGVGNVAVDVVRILAKTADELRSTDVPEPVLRALTDSRVKEIHMIGRRGPAQAKFTTKELRELGELPGTDVVVLQDEADLTTFDMAGEGEALAGSDRRVRGNVEVIRRWAESVPEGRPRRLTVRFWLKPAEITGDEHVTGLRVERTRLDETGRLHGTGEFQQIPAQLILRSVGYQSVQLPGVPFDPGTATVPNEQGRVLDADGSPLPGEYVAGWLKRGPTGVIGTNKSDAAETVRSLLADLTGQGDGALPRAGLLRFPEAAAGAGDRAPIDELIERRGIRAISYQNWLAIEAREVKLAAELDRGERVKLPTHAELLAACDDVARL